MVCTAPRPLGKLEWPQRSSHLLHTGIRSIVRSRILELRNAQDGSVCIYFNEVSPSSGAHQKVFLARPTGDSAYRATIPRETLEPYPDLMHFVNANIGMRWMGPGAHLMAYPIRAGQASLVFSQFISSSNCPPSSSTTSWLFIRTQVRPQRAG
jgi:hypothetical protein